MNCLICGAKLTKQDVCLACGTDIRLYREIIQTSNRYYNLGLEYAKRRDLTGARTALLQCLNLNKKNIDARNLLGLVYYELGEIVYALREWVISKNFQEKDNLADYYLTQAEHSEKVLASNVHRYNNALHYLEIESRDLALLQLKRIAAKQYKNVKAFQLLALLYMQDGQYQKAERLLKRCYDIDNGDPTTLRYMEALRDRKKTINGSISDAIKEATEATHEEDGVITPATAIREYSSYFVYVMYMAIGFIVGIMMVFFVVVPSVKSSEQNKANQMLEDSHSEITNLQIDILRLEADKSLLDVRIDELTDELKSKEGDISTGQVEVDKMNNLVAQYRVLLDIMNEYLEEDYLSAINAFMSMDATLEDDEIFRSIFSAIKQDMTSNMWYRLYYTGVKRVNERNFEMAAAMLAKSHELYSYSPEVLFYLGYSYEMLNNRDAMKDAYKKIVSDFPESTWAQQATERLRIYGIK